MKVLVTGPTGLLGNNLVRELLKDQRFEVNAFVHSDRSRKRLEGLQVNIIIGDILDQERVKTAIAGMDIVFHCAASTKIYPPRDPKIYDVNVNGTKNIMEACLYHKTKRLIYVGTANSFGMSNSSDILRDEKSMFNGAKVRMGYMDSKKEAQDIVLEAVRQKGLNALVINPTTMFGPFDHLPSSGKVIPALFKGKIPGYTDGGRNYINVKDVCLAMINSIELGRIGECYIIGNKNLTHHELFSLISKELNVKPPRIKFPSWLTIIYGTLGSFFARVLNYKPTLSKEFAIASTKYFFYDNSKAINELGLTLTPISDAIHECYEWFKQENYL